MHPRTAIARSGSALTVPVRIRTRVGPTDLLAGSHGARRVLATAGDRRLASKLFETYKDQMAREESDGSDDAGDSGTDIAREAVTQGDRQRKISGRSRRGVRQSRPATSYTEGKLERRKKRDKYFFTREDGSLRPLIGVHGGGEPQWWALRVTVGREKQTCTNIERRYQQLREAAEAEGTTEGLQEIETWDVWKRVRAWNPKSQKMGNKMVRYDGGGWVLVRAILDSRVASIISGNINILGYHHREVFEGEEFPIPADSELIGTLAAWQEDLKDITEEEVREEMGLGPKRDDVDYYDDFEDYGRGRRRDRDSDSSMDRERGRRAGGRTNAGLFSSQGSEDGWDNGSSWYGGESGEGQDEGLLLDNFDDLAGFGTSGTSGTADPVNEFGAWLGDFNAGTGSEDWMGTTMSDENNTGMERTTPSSSHDDLSWWDEDEGVVEGSKGGDAAEASRTRGGLFTDDEASTWSSTDEFSPEGVGEARPLTVVNGEFKDFDGVLVEDGDQVVKVEVDVFGLPTVVEIPREDVEFT